MLQGLEFEADDGGLIGGGGGVDVGGVGVIDQGGSLVADKTAAASRMQSKTPDVAFGKAASISR